MDFQVLIFYLPSKYKNTISKGAAKIIFRNKKVRSFAILHKVK